MITKKINIKSGFEIVVTKINDSVQNIAIYDRRLDRNYNAEEKGIIIPINDLPKLHEIADAISEVANY